MPSCNSTRATLIWTWCCRQRRRGRRAGAKGMYTVGKGLGARFDGQVVCTTGLGARLVAQPFSSFTWRKKKTRRPRWQGTRIQ